MFHLQNLLSYYLQDILQEYFFMRSPAINTTLSVQSKL